MRKVCDWVFGSFFRTIGRVLVFVLIGIILSHLIDFNNILGDFKITNLFFEKVNAEELNTYSTEWYLENGNAITNQIAGYSFQQNQSNYQGSQHNFKYYFNSNKNPIGVGAGYDYLSFNIGSYIWFTTNTSNVLSETDTFTCLINSTTSSGQNSDYKYQSITCPKTYTEEEVYEQQATYFYQVRLYYGDNSYSVCDLNSAHAGGGFVKCNLSVHKDSGLKYLSVWVGVDNFDSSIGGGSYWIKFGVSKAYNVAISTDTQINNSINNQTQQQHNDHEETQNYLEDTNTTQANSQGEDFINNFSNNSHGLTGIITAPLNAIQSLASATCSNLVLPLPFTNNKTLNLPCMSTIYTNHFGVFYTMYQGIILALISYWVCVRLFTLVKGFKDPEDDKIEVMDL